LDTAAREKVSAYLQKKKGFILVSHDRCFLDGCVDHILSLNRNNIEVQSGNYSSFMRNFEQQQQFELSQNERLKKDIHRLQQSAQRTAVWSDRVEASKIGAADKGFVGHKAAKMMKRSKSTEARQQQAIEQKSALLKNVETADFLKIQPLTYRTDVLASFSDVSVIYDDRPVFQPMSFEIRRRERIFLDGKNGCGKSSLLKLLSEYAPEHTGTVTIGSGLVISYVPQDTSHLGGTLSQFAEKHHLDESLFKAILRKMDFERVQFEKDISDFSGGQKKKVLIAKSLCEQAHLYVWDEPLNFIDVYSRMQIEQLIETFSPTMLLVEHDNAFREAIATQVIRL
jgi:lincosamide and streptogramin A transport system ATP-binding/permease protein